MIVISLMLSTMLLNCNSGDKEVMVVPKNCKGYVVIIYNQKNGVPAKYEMESVSMKYFKWHFKNSV